jgi:hypothetical protein
VCVCVCVRERERGNQLEAATSKSRTTTTTAGERTLLGRLTVGMTGSLSLAFPSASASDLVDTMTLKGDCVFFCLCETDSEEEQSSTDVCERVVSCMRRTGGGDEGRRGKQQSGEVGRREGPPHHLHPTVLVVVDDC